MNVKRLSLAVSLVVVAPAAISAQAAACNIELGKPGQVKDANGALAKAALFQNKPEQIVTAAKEAFAKLAKEEAKVIAANPVGRAMVMGTAYAELAALADTLPALVTRTTVGIPGDGDFDWIAAADSMLDVVDASNPACKEQTEEPRRKVYARLLNRAANLYNAQQQDSAAMLSERGLRIYDGYKLAYIAHNIIGNVKQGKDDLDGAVLSFISMTDMMKGDSTLVEDRKNTMANVAQLMMAHAEGLEGDAKKAKLTQTTQFLQKVLAEFPGDPKAEASLARAQIMSGDDAAASKYFETLASNPEKYSESQLMEAAVNAARADKSKEALTLFNAGLKKNPYSRDGLFNAAITAQKLEAWSEAEGLIRKLIAVDPENPEAYQILARNYQEGSHKTKVTIDSLRKVALDAANDKKTTTAQKNAIAAQVRTSLEPMEAQFKTSNDSLLANFNRFQSAKAKVAFNLWSHDGNKHVLAGTVENLSDASADYTVKFEFLDANGAVVASKEAALPGMASKASKAFRLEVEGAGIVAFKYAPFSGS